MDGDVEVDIDPADAENDAFAFDNGSLMGGSLSSPQLSPFNSNYSNPRSRDTSFDAEVSEATNVVQYCLRT